MRKKHQAPATRHRFIALFGFLGVFLLLPPGARAGDPPTLEMPIRCIPGQDCWLVNYVDLDPGTGVRDYTCAKASYDGHKGTDIAIVDAAAMRDGVPVYAAAAGIVRGARNTMKDINFKQNGGRDSVANRECGNGALIDHGDGWETQYCHMMKGSVIVRPGDKVSSGRQLGLVGLSGLTEFPHIHMQVKYKGEIVDPFVGLKRKTDCGAGENPLWSDQAIAAMAYRPTAIFKAGFASTTPNSRFAREGLYGEEYLLDTSPVIALWADMYWVKAGDKITFLIVGPDGKSLVGHSSVLKKPEARRFVFAGLRRKDTGWIKGSYTGTITLTRPGTDETISVVRVIDVN